MEFSFLGFWYSLLETLTLLLNKIRPGSRCIKYHHVREIPKSQECSKRVHKSGEILNCLTGKRTKKKSTTMFKLYIQMTKKCKK